MNVDDLRQYFGVKTDNEVAIKLNKTKGAISKWRAKGVPVNAQAVLQIQSKGVLVADLSPKVEVCHGD